jgi:hypothetical protein
MATELAQNQQDALQEAPNLQNKVEAVSEAQTELPQWKCRVEGKPSDEQWTVGETFVLNCEGPTVEFASTELTFQEKDKTGYELRILEVEKQTENHLILQATSYVPQAHQFKDLQIQDQGHSVARVEPFQLPVKSVITNPNQKPYGPAGAVTLSYPTWLTLVLVAALLGSFIYWIFWFRRRRQMRGVIEELKQHNTALGAFNQFNKDLRVLGRKHIFGDDKHWSEQAKQRYIENLDEIFRLYLLREFYVPALDWSSGPTLRSIAKQDKAFYPRYGAELSKCLKELDRAKEDVQKLQAHDCQQLTQMTKKVTQAIWRLRKR